jgi:hypothetical protein
MSAIFNMIACPITIETDSRKNPPIQGCYQEIRQ